MRLKGNDFILKQDVGFFGATYANSRRARSCVVSFTRPAAPGLAARNSKQYQWTRYCCVFQLRARAAAAADEENRERC